MTGSLSTHVKIGNAKPYPICVECKQEVTYWHDSSRCGCKDNYFNYPCGHEAEVLPG